MIVFKTNKFSLSVGSITGLNPFIFIPTVYVEFYPRCKIFGFMWLMWDLYVEYVD